MITTASIHLEEKTKVTVRHFDDFVSLSLNNMSSLMFRNDEHLRSFAESILQQLEKKEEVSAS